MKNSINTLEVKNFKSIKHVNIDCKRINLFIGKPNVGKSNILEAISLFDAPVCNPSRPFLSEFMRFEKASNLFYDQDRKNIIHVNTNIGCAALRFHLNQINQYDICFGPSKEFVSTFHSESTEGDLTQISGKYRSLASAHKYQPGGTSVDPFYASFSDEMNNFNSYSSASKTTFVPVKRYIFKSLEKQENNFPLFLRPPFGDNLYTIIESNPRLYEEIAHFFREYELDLLIDTASNKLEVQKRVGNRVYKIPYSLAADTLQRIIFHLAAIKTNKDSVLLFEEPEAHSYPPYVSMLGDTIIEDKFNQYFVATHSHYLLTSFIEQCEPPDISIFITTYENYETKIRALTNAEVENIMETGIDFFFNTSAFQ